MIIQDPGAVSDRIFMLGRQESNIYLLRGDDEYVLLGGGTAHIIPEVEAQIAELGVEVKTIKRMVILHSHFDHCGCIPYFKQKWPWATITASARAKQVLTKPKALESISFLSQVALQNHHLQDKIHAFGIDPFAIGVEQTVGEGDTLPCGSLTLQIMEVPGHSSCSIAVYVPQERALFASDAGGIVQDGHITIAANSNFDQYQQSLARMAKLDVAVYLAEHFGARTSEDAEGFLEASMAAATEFRDMLEDSLRQTGNVQESTQQILEIMTTQKPETFLPREVQAMVLGQMLTYLSKQAL